MPLMGSGDGVETYDEPIRPNWKAEPEAVTSSECSWPAATCVIGPRCAAAVTRVGMDLSPLLPSPSRPQLPAPNAKSAFCCVSAKL